MGVGIWSMHFIGMLAFSVQGLAIYYDVPLMFLSIMVAIIASALALYVVGSRQPTPMTYVVGSLTMGAAIAGMHYIGIWSMRMQAHIMWDWTYVFLSIAIAITASYVALLIAFKLRSDLSLKGFLFRGLGGVLMGFAIAGMHYTAMAAMHLIPDATGMTVNQTDLLATDGLAATVVVATIVILGIALSGSNVERALTKKTFQNETLQASLALRDEFFSVASHELKTPLTSLKLQNELLMRSIERDGIDSEKILSMLTKNGKSISRLNRLVDDMLDTSRVSSGKLNLQKEPCDLSSMVNDVLARFKPILEEAGCQVTFLRANTIEGNWDRYRLEQVVTNLLTNAAKYAPGKPVMIKVDATENIGIISVKDFGRGISEEDQPKIFNRFERAKREGDLKGLGLGLFISKEIIEMHKGTIEVFSKMDEGSEFIVKLPVGENQLS